MAKYIFANGVNNFQGSLTGAHRRYLELIRYLSGENVVTLVCAPLPELDGNKNIHKINIPTCKIGCLPYSWSGLIHSVRGLKGTAAEGYDWAVSFGPWQTFAFRLAGIKQILTLLREDTLNYIACAEKNPVKKALKLIYFWIVEAITVRCSTRMIVQCNDDYKYLLQRHPLLRGQIQKKTFIQKNNVNPSWVSHEGKLALPADTKDVVRIAYVASFDNVRKGYDILFPAIIRLLEEGYPVRLYVAGEGRQLEQLKAQYGTRCGITFLGRIDNACALLRKVDFSLVPSHRDSCPNTVLEALGVGTTVYGSKVGGIKDLLPDEFLFADTTEALYEFLKNKLDHRLWIPDGQEQRLLSQSLIFNWGEKIESYMKEA